MLRASAAVVAVLAGVLWAPGAARAVPIVDLVLIAQDATQATLRVDLTMSDAGLYGYSFSARFSAGLTFAGGQNLPVPGMIENAGAFNNGGAGPGIVTLIHGLQPPPFSPIGAGAQTFSVAELTFDLNGIGGLVETGIFFPGVDGFAGPDGFSDMGEFDASQLAAIEFSSLQLVPEPSTALLFAIGLGALAARGRRP